MQAIILAHCANNVVDWVNDWVWTYDPRRKPSNLPFLLFPRQADYLRWRTDRYEGKERGLVEKSRDMGVTWLNVAWQVHRWLFEDGFKGSFGSRKVELVDRIGDPDSIFEKARMILRMLPQWMMPEGFDWKKHDNFLRLVNPANGSTITGEGGDNMGRGGRSSIYDIDEAAFIERPQKVEAAVSQNSDCVIETSTPNGMDNPFAMRRHAGRVEVFTLHWKDDPRKGDDWYQRQVDNLDPVTVAQEIDIDYNASRDSVVVVKSWVDDAMARALYESQRGALSIGGDIAYTGKDKSASIVREGLNILSVDEWHGNDPVESGDRFIRLGLDLALRLKPKESLYFFIDGNGIGAGTIAHIRRFLQLQKEKGKEHRWVIVDVQAGSSASDPKYRRKRDELWWKTREWFRDQQPAISQDIDRKLRDKLSIELASPGYRVGPDGVIIIESKDEMKRRGVASPNLADALIHTFDFEALKPEPPKKKDGWRDTWDTGNDWMTG